MKYCIKCGIEIYGRSRKYCPECKRLTHLNQMRDNYKENKSEYQKDGKYYDKQSKLTADNSWMYRYERNQSHMWFAPIKQFVEINIECPKGMVRHHVKYCLNDPNKHIMLMKNIEHLQLHNWMKKNGIEIEVY